MPREQMSCPVVRSESARIDLVGRVVVAYLFMEIPKCARDGTSADCDELEYDVAWLVTALQKVVSDLVVKPI
jgi:hypothetical protein